VAEIEGTIVGMTDTIAMIVGTTDMSVLALVMIVVMIDMIEATSEAMTVSSEEEVVGLRREEEAREEPVDLNAACMLVALRRKQEHAIWRPCSPDMAVSEML